MIEDKVSASELAKVLGVSSRHLRRLRAEGWIKTDEAGAYRWSLAIPGFRDYCTHQAESREQRDGSKEVFRRERARLVAEQAATMALKNEEMRRMLFPRQDVERCWAEIVTAVRQGLQAISPTIARKYPHLASCSDVLAAEIDEALTVLGSNVMNGGH